MRNARAGFTLLEILVVLAILGMGMAIVSSMMRNSALYSERVEEDTQVQLTCDSMMSSILSGNRTATIGVEMPIPDAPNWTVKVELLDGPIKSVVAVRITAQRYDQMELATANNPGTLTVVRTPTPGRTFVIKEWARRADVHTRVVSIAADGSTTAIDGTGETVANDLNPQQGIDGTGETVANDLNPQQGIGGSLSELGADGAGQELNGSFFDSLDTSLGLGGGVQQGSAGRSGPSARGAGLVGGTMGSGVSGGALNPSFNESDWLN